LGTDLSVHAVIIIIFLAHQHKACRQLKIKQEMTIIIIIIIIIITPFSDLW